LLLHDLRSFNKLEGYWTFTKGGADPEFNSVLIDNAISSVELMKNTDSLTTIVKQKKAFEGGYKGAKY
jgi:hypothetical protein